MTEITAITSLIGSVKSAVEIAKVLSDTNRVIEQAELKLKIAELMGTLADTKIKAAEIQDLIREKDNRIAELEKALEIKAKLVRNGDAYYDSDSNGKPTGIQYCTHCWEVKHLAVHLHRVELDNWLCSSCKTEYHRVYIRELK